MLSSHTLSEHESRKLLADHGVPMAPWGVAATAEEAATEAEQLGFPAVAKLTGPAIAHKTERGLVRLALADAEAVSAAASELLQAARPQDGEVGVLVSPMLSGTRELIIGLHHDPRFAMTVMVGIGGVQAEARADTAFRLAPISRLDAHEMIDDLQNQALLGEFRGEPAVDRDLLAAALVGLSEAAGARSDVVGADVNPLIVVDGAPVGVDALVECRP